MALRRSQRSLAVLLQFLTKEKVLRSPTSLYTPAATLQKYRQSYALISVAQFSAAKKGKTPNVSEEIAAAELDLKETKRNMDKAVERLQDVLASVRVGRASPGMLDHLKVDIYGDRISLKSLGSVSVRDNQLLVVSAFDPETVQNIEKAIRESPLQLNPRIEGEEVLVPVPRPNVDTVKAMAKMIKQEGEATRVAVRNARRIALEQVKKHASADAKRKEEKQVQKLTDDIIRAINKMCEAKEAELSSVS